MHNYGDSLPLVHEFDLLQDHLTFLVFFGQLLNPVGRRKLNIFFKRFLLFLVFHNILCDNIQFFLTLLTTTIFTVLHLHQFQTKLNFSINQLFELSVVQSAFLVPVCHHLITLSFKTIDMIHNLDSLSLSFFSYLVDGIDNLANIECVHAADVSE